MKKAMITLICIISTLLSIAFAMYSRTNDEEYLDNIERNKQATTFYIRDSSITQNEQLRLFHELSKEYHATFVRSDKLINNQGKEITYKSGVFDNDYLTKDLFDLTKGKIFTKKNEFIATFTSNSHLQTGTIRDLFADNPLIVQNLDNFYLKHHQDVNGIYTLVVNRNYKDEIIKKISMGLGVSKKSLLTKKMDHGYGEGTIYLLILILCAVIFSIFCLMSVFYPMTRLKEIGVRKLQGYSNLLIWTSLNSHSLLVPIFIFLISIIPQLLLIKNSGVRYFLWLGLIQLAFFFICIIFSILMLFVIKKFNISNLLKGYFNSKISLYFSYTLKFFVIVTLIAIIPMITREYNIFKSELSAQDTYKNESKYLTLSSYQFVGDDMQNFLTGNTNLEKKLIQMQLELEKTAESEFVRTTLYHGKQMTQFSENKIHFNPTDKYYIMQVNENYLKRLKILPETNVNKLFTSGNITFLVPSSYKNQKKQLQFIIHDQANDLLPEKQRKTNIYDSPAKLVYYHKKIDHVFSENIDLISVNNGFVTDPILICLGREYFIPDNTYLTDRSLSNPIRIINSKKNRAAIELAIKNADLIPNNLQFDNVLDTGFRDELNVSKTSLIAWITIAITILFVSILSSYYIVLIILISKSKQMMVSRLMGYPMFEQYKNECLYFLALYIFGFGELLILTTDIISIMLYLLLIIIDGFIIFIMVKHHDQKSLVLLLKGEE